MQESKLQSSIHIEEDTQRTVFLFLSDKLWAISGNLQWNFNSNSIYCSQVMSFPFWFEGTKSIIHPDDIQKLKHFVSNFKNGGDSLLTFRIITTYGEVHEISGNELLVEEKVDNLEMPQETIISQTIQSKFIQKELEKFQKKQIVYDRADKFLNMGTWYMSLNTREMQFSDNVYLIFGLQPQSLNNHLHTFSSFIHPEDKKIVDQAFDKAFKLKVPLNLDYRIISADGKIKIINAITNWALSTTGDQLVYGIIRDISSEQTVNQNIEISENKIRLIKNILSLDENYLNIGHWNLNLYTQKAEFSESYHRIFGLKQKSLTHNINSFLLYVHPEDYALVLDSINKINKDEAISEINFRIIRNDGKTRFIRQKTRIISISNELIIIGFIQDITSQKIIERKLKQTEETASLIEFCNKKGEEMANMGSWLWDLSTNEINWSDGFYMLLGYKPKSIELTQNRLLTLIHPEDKKKFNNELTQVLKDQIETEFEFKMLGIGKIKYIKASFKIMNIGSKIYFTANLRDISQEHAVQQELFDRVQLADSLIESMEDIIIITDPYNLIILSNQKCEETFGQKRKDIENKNFFEIFPELKSDLIVNSINKVLKNETVIFPHYSFPALKEFYDFQMIPLINNEGMCTGILHVLHNVTHEYKMQQNLAERLDFIESLIDANVDPVIALDCNMNYISWNRKAEEFYGINGKDIIGKNVLEIFPNIESRPSYEDFRNALKGQKIIMPIEKDKDGTFLEEFLIPVKDARNEVTAILWMSRDKTIENNLRRERRKSEDIFNAINECYFELNKEYKITFINKTGQEFFKKSSEELLNKNIWDCFPAALHTSMYNAMIDVMEKGGVRRSEFNLPSENLAIFATIAPFQQGIIVFFFDIQYIKENELKLSKSMEQWRALVENTPHAITIWDMDGRLLFANKAFIVKTGLNLNDILDCTYEEMGYSQEISSSWKKVIKETFDSRQEKEHISIIRGKDNNEMYFHSRLVPEFNHKGTVLSVLSITWDITEIRQKQEALKNINEELNLKNQIYKYSEEIALLGTWTWNPKTNQVFYSDNLYTLYGLHSKFLKPGMDNIHDYLHPDDKLIMLSSAEKIKNYTDSSIKEYKVKRKDGKEGIFRSRSKSITVENGDQLIIGITQDITEEASLQKQLLERTRYAETIFDASVDRIFVLDLSFHIIAWNNKSEEITGYKKKDIIGKNFFTIFPKTSEDAILSDAFRRVAKGEYVHIPPKSGIYTNKCYERFFVPLKNVKEDQYAILVIMHDVTDSIRKTKELKLLNDSLEKKNNELEEKNEEITQFSFVASHDLKEPLRKIHTFSDWLINQEIKNVSEQGKNYLLKLGESINRLENLIEDVLTLTKIHADKHQTENINLSEILEKVQEEFSVQINESSAKIISNKLPVIRGNSNQIYQLFKNLISNSIKFQLKGNTPLICVKAQQVFMPVSETIKNEGDYLLVSFIDNGIGIDPQYSKIIFQLFQRLHGRNEFGGTGMGLAICKKIMENHGGAITVVSTPGNGAEFNCFFPLF